MTREPSSGSKLRNGLSDTPWCPASLKDETSLGQQYLGHLVFSKLLQGGHDNPRKFVT